MRPGARRVPAPTAPPTGRSAPVVLLWHGVGPDGARGQLLTSVRFAGERASGLAGDAEAIVLAGWSRGGRAAAGIAVDPTPAGGWRPAAVVCLASGFTTPAPTTGTAPAADLTTPD